jgi:ADP-ribose pyrophosphatase YjhB (NUDIX family)
MIDLLWRIGLRIAIRLLRVLWYFRRPEPQGAYVAVCWDDRLLLIRNSYRKGEAVPCGAVGRGETAARAAVRELAEEVGIETTEADLQFACEIVLPFDFKIDHAQFFELHLRNAPQVRVDNREVVWADFVPAAELSERSLIPHPRGYLAHPQTSADGATSRDD